LDFRDSIVGWKKQKGGLRPPFCQRYQNYKLIY
jgi:hypothetical protein